MNFAMTNKTIFQVLYTGIRIAIWGVSLNRFTVECMINDHYTNLQVSFKAAAIIEQSSPGV